MVVACESCLKQSKEEEEEEEGEVLLAILSLFLSNRASCLIKQ